ncbi:hypothetical protein Ccar_10570 [Clostridium carboxidivorans P7]|uniref:YmaF family protein n=1 Tax=Clostridium carboxidivorans P7 TaxID=536227 RepID=C6PNX2_9CLOT|nr:YmaF family protein [Clostridium carboxidivorans]AKN31271.1 hypothetical protein Ccar_10570 [Clostridium carboxidivorans P7]EET89050.1 conserved hypothetical protein [Clostridium carboxidivorans P7]EFG88398.1 hypothetical protein CLCAR_1974 [Clostridium carboxidivorans P7]
MPEHSHSYSGRTTYSQGHVHHYGEITDMAPSGVPHNHFMQGSTTFNHGHYHNYVTRTGPATYLPDGRHYHYFQTMLRRADGHIHYISGYTSAD